MPLGASFFDQTVFPYVDGYPDDLSELSEVMPLVLWSGLVHSPWDHAGEEGFGRRSASGRPCDVDRPPHGGRLQPLRGLLRCIDNFLMDLVADGPTWSGSSMRSWPSTRHAERVLAVGDLADVIRFGDD
jgi:uroporphyrinogen decarboxylase